MTEYDFSCVSLILFMFHIYQRCSTCIIYVVYFKRLNWNLCFAFIITLLRATLFFGNISVHIACMYAISQELRITKYCVKTIGGFHLKYSAASYTKDALWLDHNCLAVKIIYNMSLYFVKYYCMSAVVAQSYFASFFLWIREKLFLFPLPWCGWVTEYFTS